MTALESVVHKKEGTRAQHIAAASKSMRRSCSSMRATVDGGVGQCNAEHAASEAPWSQLSASHTGHARGFRLCRCSSPSLPSAAALAAASRVDLERIESPWPTALVWPLSAALVWRRPH